MGECLGKKKRGAGLDNNTSMVRFMERISTVSPRTQTETLIEEETLGTLKDVWWQRYLRSPVN